VRPSEWMQGHAFMGPSTRPQPYLYGFRGRMTSATTGAFGARRTLRLHPQLHAALDLRPARRLHVPDANDAGVERLFDEGSLTRPSRALAAQAAEELYDLAKDPDEVMNLAGSAEHQDVLQRMCKAQQTGP